MLFRVLFLTTIVCFTISALSWAYWLYLRSQTKKTNESLWMYCYSCGVKWRPTAYGLITPDDYFCPECNRDGGVRPIRDVRQIIRRKE